MMQAVTIHEPAVVFTDLGLALLGALFARRLFAAGPAGPLGHSPAILMAGLASAAFWGAVFHAFFPDDTATLAGFLAWIPVTLSIVVAAAALLDMALRAAARRMDQPVRLAIVGAYALAFAVTVVLVDESFTTVVRFYGPALLLFLAAATVRALWRGAGGVGSRWDWRCPPAPRCCSSSRSPCIRHTSITTRSIMWCRPRR